MKPPISISNLAAAALIVLFVYTALSKLSDLSFFRAQLHFYPWIGSVSGIISVVLPVSELVVGALLFFPKTRPFGLYGSALLLVCFTGYLLLMLWLHGAGLPCTCGGVLQQMTWKQHLFFNLGFLLLSCWAIRRTPHGKKFLLQ